MFIELLQNTSFENVVWTHKMSSLGSASVVRDLRDTSYMTIINWIGILFQSLKKKGKSRILSLSMMLMFQTIITV